MTIWENISDEEIAARAREGCDLSFNELVRRYSPMVYRIALGVSGSHQEAEDIVQETFLKVFRNLDGFSPSKAGFKTWILTIARSQSLDTLRSLKRRWMRFITGEDTEENSVVYGSETDGAYGQDPESLMGSRQFYLALDNALAKLPKEQRMALILKTQEDLSYSEIAEIMNTSHASVDSLIYRARKKLHGLLKEDT